MSHTACQASSLLGMVCDAGHAPARPLLEGAVAWLLDQRLDPAARSVFATWVAPEIVPEPARLAGDSAAGRLDGIDRNRMTRSGQASYHVDLDVALLGRRGKAPPIALVGNGRVGL